MTPASATGERTYCRVDLTLHGPWRVGTWEQLSDGDEAHHQQTQRQARTWSLDGEEMAYLPGSSLRGSLRDHVTRALQSDAAAVMGPPPPQGQAEAEGIHASPWWVLGVAFDAPPTADRIQARRQTSIERTRRAPSRGGLRTTEITEADHDRVHLYLRYDHPPQVPSGGAGPGSGSVQLRARIGPGHHDFDSA